MIVIEKEKTKKAQMIDDWIDLVLTEGRNLTKWEISFIESIADQWMRKKFLTQAQFEVLERIYAEKTP